MRTTTARSISAAGTVNLLGEGEAKRADGFGGIGRAPVGEAQGCPLAKQGVERENVMGRLTLGFHGFLDAISRRIAPHRDFAQDRFARRLALYRERLPSMSRAGRDAWPRRACIAPDLPPLAVTRTPRPDCSSSNTIMSRRPAGHSKFSILRCVSFIARPMRRVRKRSADP